MRQELVVLKSVDHPNIAAVTDLLEDNNNFYIVSELVKGETL